MISMLAIYSYPEFWPTLIAYVVGVALLGHFFYWLLRGRKK